MKPIAIIAIIAAVVVVGGACAGVAFSGVLNGGTTGPGGDDPVVPTEPVEPTPTETPTPTPTPTETQMSTFAPMTSSGSSSSGSSTPAGCSHANVEWVSDDAGSHSKVCKDCRETLGAAEECSTFDYFVLDAAANTHLKKCKVCGYEDDEGCVSAGLSHDGVDTHSAKCKHCNDPMTTSENCESYLTTAEHVGGTVTHIQTCNLCGHDYVTYCSGSSILPVSEKPGYHSGECDTCHEPYDEPVECTPSSYTSNGDGVTHTVACACGYTFDNEECSSFNHESNNNEVDHKVICKCGQEIDADEPCTFGEPTALLTLAQPVMVAKCQVCNGEKRTPIVAAIGTTYYTSLDGEDGAIAQATENQEIILMAPMDTPVTIPEGKKVIINPNGKKTLLNYESITDIQVMKNLGAESALTVAGDMAVDSDESADSELLVVNYAKNSTAMYICTADGLVAFEQEVNAGDVFSGKTVMLFSDIDLSGINWNPIGGVESYGTGSGTFAGTFDGQDHTISNMVVTDNIQNWAAAGFFGSITGVVKNLNIDNATVTSTHYAGGIVGYSSANGMKIENCKVTNSNITSTPELLADGSYDNGDKVGGIIGYMVAGDVVTGCIVENTNITGYRDIGGIVGHSVGAVTNNKVKDVVLVINNEHNYKNYVFYTIDEYDAGEIVGEGTADNTNTYDEVTIKFAAGTYTLPSDDKMKDQTITITGNKDMIIDTTAGFGATNGATLTFDGVTVKFDNGTNYKGFTHTKKVVYNNCVIIGQQTMYAPEVEFSNCVFVVDATGYNVWTYGATDVTFTDCTFNTGGRAVLVYNEVTNENFVANIEFNNCVFKDDGTYSDPKAAVETGTNGGNTETSNKYNLTFTGCTVDEGFDENNSTSALWGNKNSMDKDHLNVVIDGVDVY